MVNVLLNYLPIALFLSDNHPELYCRTGVVLVKA